MSNGDDLSYLRRSASVDFEPVPPENDYILSKDHAPPGLENETYWFSFDLPELGIIGNVYCWIHTQLRMASAGVMIWQGVKRYYHQAEHFNYQQFLPYPLVTDDGVDVPEIGLKIRIVEPHVRHEIHYDDPDTNTSLRLQTRGLMPAVKAVGRPHLEQAMHVSGEMVLNGQRHAVNANSMRDRSWRGKRPEASAKHPPIAYVNGISLDGTVAFNFCGSDDPDRGADWADRYDIPKSALFLEGWVHREGRLHKIVGMSRVTVRDPDDFNRVLSWECTLQDEDGRQHVIKATRQAAMPFAPWYNIFCDWLQMRFELDGGIVGYAMSNESFWGDYARTIKGPQ